MNARSHPRQAAADDGDVTPGYRSLLLVRTCLLNDFDPFVSRAGAQSQESASLDVSDSILGNAHSAPAPGGWISETRWHSYLEYDPVSNS